MLQRIPLQDNVVMHNALQLFGGAADWDRTGEQEGTQHFPSVPVSAQCGLISYAYEIFWSY